MRPVQHDGLAGASCCWCCSTRSTARSDDGRRRRRRRDQDPLIAAARRASCSGTSEQLQATIEQYETSTEELKASNEELQAINEELRSATEELETSKEELQSTNEELITVNHELKMKVDETGEINDDLQNLIASTDIATVFVDRAHAHQALHAGGGDALQPDRRRRRPLAARHHAPARLRRPGRGRPARCSRPCATIEREVRSTDGR